MKQFTKFLFTTLVALMVACSGGGTQVASNSGGISGTGDGSGKSSISGASYKGPMLQNSSIKIFPITNLTQALADTTVQSNVGDFSLNLDNGIYSMQATGRYYDEVAGVFSTDTITLKTTANITANSNIVINVLTHIAHNYTVALLNTGSDYATATDAAKVRALALLKPITGEAAVSSAFNQIGLTQTSGDTAYLAYLSTLIVQTASDNSALTVNGILGELAEDVNNDTSISAATLDALVISHANIDEQTVDQNIQQIFNSTNTATIEALVIEIDVFNPAMPAPTYEKINSGADYRFFFDGSSTDGSGGISGRVILANGSYEIQISKVSDFASLEITDSSIPSNTYQTSSSNLPDPVKHYVRVRKVKNNGQLSQWSGVLEFTPVP